MGSPRDQIRKNIKELNRQTKIDLPVAGSISDDLHKALLKELNTAVKSLAGLQKKATNLKGYYKKSVGNVVKICRECLEDRKDGDALSVAKRIILEESLEKLIKESNLKFVPYARTNRRNDFVPVDDVIEHCENMVLLVLSNEKRTIEGIALEQEVKGKEQMDSLHI